MWLAMRELWRAMFIPPWRKIAYTSPPRHFIVWTLGWLWSFLGLVLGAFIATPILRQVGLENTPLQDWATYGIALLSAFVVQVASFWVWVLLGGVVGGIFGGVNGVLATVTRTDFSPLSETAYDVVLAMSGLLTLAGGSYALYRFIQTQNVNQGLVTTYVIGGFILKSIVLPIIKSLGVAVIVKPIFRWLQGSDSETQKAD